MGGRGVQFIGMIAAALCLAACQSPQTIGDAALATGAIAPIFLQMRDLASPSGIVLSTPMPSSGRDAAPSGFIAFCGRQPDQCTEGNGDPATFPLSDQNWSLLQAVNLAFNNAIAPMEDAIHYGRVDYWTIPKDGYGDCEDYALAKRKALADAGLPRAALRIAVARLADGEAHAVLTVATDRGDYVLDNRSPAILPWAKTGLTWIARQTPGETAWAAIEDTRLAFGR